MTGTGSVFSQQLVNTNFGPRFGIHALNNDRRVKAAVAFARRQAAGHDHGAGRDTSVQDFIFIAIINPCALSDVYTHRNDGTNVLVGYDEAKWKTVFN